MTAATEGRGRLRDGLGRFVHWARTTLRGVLPSAGSGERPRQALGRRAERDAARFLTGRGYRILERNFRCREGEIDLVSFKDGVIAFVEVRSRTEPTALDPLHTITPSKRQRLVRAAHQYVSLHSLECEDVALRFDVVALHYSSGGKSPRAHHIEDAFTT